MKITIMGYGAGKSYKLAYELCRLPDAVMLTPDKRHVGWIHNTITKMEERGLITSEAAISAKKRVKVYGDKLAGTSFRQVLIDDLDLIMGFYENRPVTLVTMSSESVAVFSHNCPPEDKWPR